MTNNLGKEVQTSRTHSQSQGRKLRVVGLAVSTSAINEVLEDLFSEILGKKFDFVACVSSCRMLGHYRNERQQTVLVTFNDKNIRDQIYMSRWKLGCLNSNIFINEDLKKETYQQFKSIRTFSKTMGIKKVWTYNEEIIVKFQNKKMKVKCVQELKDLLNKSN